MSSPCLAKEALVTPEFLRGNFSYSPETGVMTRLSTGRACDSAYPTGYLRTNIGKESYLVHRLVWLFSYGTWPSGVIDHINGMTSDNRISNLRDVSGSENTRNQRHAHSRSKSGLMGASWHKGKRRWRARIYDGRYIDLGHFKTAEEAHVCYIKAKKELHGVTL